MGETKFHFKSLNFCSLAILMAGVYLKVKQNVELNFTVLPRTQHGIIDGTSLQPDK